MSKGSKGLTLMIVIGLIVFLFLYNFPKKVDISYPAVEFKLDGSQWVDKTTVTIKGKLKRPLFRSRIFEGEVTVDKYPRSGEDKKIEQKQFEISKSERKGQDLYMFGISSIIATEGANGVLKWGIEKSPSVGLVWTDEKFETFSFYAFLDDYDFTILSAPATTYDEAVQIYETLTTDTDWRHFIE